MNDYIGLAIGIFSINLLGFAASAALPGRWRFGVRLVIFTLSAAPMVIAAHTGVLLPAVLTLLHPNPFAFASLGITAALFILSSGAVALILRWRPMLFGGRLSRGMLAGMILGMLAAAPYAYVLMHLAEQETRAAQYQPSKKTLLQRQEARDRLRMQQRNQDKERSLDQEGEANDGTSGGGAVVVNSSPPPRASESQEYAQDDEKDDAGGGPTP